MKYLRKINESKTSSFEKNDINSLLSDIELIEDFIDTLTEKYPKVKVSIFAYGGSNLMVDPESHLFSQRSFDSFVTLVNKINSGEIKQKIPTIQYYFTLEFSNDNLGNLDNGEIKELIDLHLLSRLKMFDLELRNFSIDKKSKYINEYFKGSFRTTFKENIEIDISLINKKDNRQ